MIYNIIACFFLILSLIEVIKYNKLYSYIIVGLFAVVMILFAGLRDGSSVGTDSRAYFFNYRYPFDYPVEYGYKYLAIFFSKMLDANYNLFLLVVNALSLSLITASIKKNSYFLVFPLLIYFSDFYLYYNFSGVRQALALAFSSFAIYYGMQRNYKVFFILLLCAMSFHISAIAFALAIIVPKKTLTIRNYVYLVLLALIGFGAIGYVIEHNEYLSYKFKYYSEIQENADNIVSLYIVGILKRSIVLILIFLFGKDLFRNERFVYLFNLYLLGFIIYIATYLISPDFGVRFSTYYTIIDMFLVGNMLYLCKKPYQKITIFLVISLMILYKINTYAILDSYTYKLFF